MFKRRLVGTALGGMASRLRDRLSLASAAIANSPEVAEQRSNAIAAYLLVRLRRPGATFIDVGAHIGSVLGEVLRQSPGPLIAFEAIPKKAADLARRFPQITIHNVALLDREGETSFFVDNAESGYSSLAGQGGNQTEIVVKVSTMDALVTDDTVDVIKIDVEGAELGVLHGAEKVVARCRPVIMFESGPTPVMGYTQEDMWRWFDERGYLVYLPERISRAARAVSLDTFLDSHEYPRRTLNYFAIPSERLAEISARAQAILGDPPA